MPDIADLRAFLAEATPPSVTATLPLKQHLREQISQLEEQFAQVGDAAGKKRRMASSSPALDLARQIKALQDEMAASSLTFHFTALTAAERDTIRTDMNGRDDQDEAGLRITAAMCRKVLTADGTEYAGQLKWTDLRDLRDQVGVAVYEAAIDAPTNTLVGGPWSVPFSLAVSLIPSTLT